jgi:hypothetical protein
VHEAGKKKDEKKRLEDKKEATAGLLKHAEL